MQLRKTIQIVLSEQRKLHMKDNCLEGKFFAIRSEELTDAPANAIVRRTPTRVYFNVLSIFYDA